MENKKSKMLIIIFALIIITLIGIILVLVFKNSSVLEKKNDTDKEVSMKENSTNTSKENKVDDEKDKEEVIKVSEICGVYRQETESEDEEVDNVIDELQLYENGMFHFTHAERTEPGCIGNYYIEDNKIILNVLFEHGSDAALYILGEVYELEIDEDNNIIGESLVEENSNMKLEKVSEDDVDIEDAEKEIIDWIKNSAKEKMIDYLND
ncbi:MAG: hypothetical protein HFJ44_01450 [Clostridia bacterium]|jgi:hypothetical protein|nr:hypothetical protein [Clostridia bacterium]